MVSSYEEMGDKLVPGICGQVDGSVIPGMVGLEAGQSGFGDIYAWFKNVLAWPLENILSKSNLIDAETKAKLIEETAGKIIPALSEEAAKVPVSESTILAVDWMNGRRTPDASQLVKGTITGLNLASSAPLIFRALVEATAFGSKAIVDRFLENGIKIESRDRHRRYLTEITVRHADLGRRTQYADQSSQSRTSLCLRCIHVRCSSCRCYTLKWKKHSKLWDKDSRKNTIRITRVTKPIWLYMRNIAN